MWKVFLFLTFFSFEISTAIQEVSENLSRHIQKRSLDNVKRMSKHPFVDLTEAINQHDLLKIEQTLNYTSRVHYSTNQLISEIKNLTWIFNLLSDTYKSRYPEANVSFCFSLSFQITKNRSDIDWRYINDVLKGHNKLAEETEENISNLKIIAQNLCQVVLDFQIDEPQSTEYSNSQAYAEKWDISFIKHAKLILKNIFEENQTIPVGVMYTESQLFIQDKVLLKQEITNADFLIININHCPLRRAPLTTRHLFMHLLDVEKAQRKYVVSGAQNKTQDYEVPLKFMLTWNEYKPTSNQDCLTCLAEDQVYLSSESLYREIFIESVKFQVYFRNLGIVSGVQLDSRKRSWLEYDLDNSGYGYLYLHVQETDVTACQLGKILVEFGYDFKKVAINEYTWSALTNYHDQMTNDECIKTQCGNDTYSSTRLPKDFMLFVTPGIGDYWNQTGNAYENLLQNSKNLQNFEISNLIFSAKDLNSDVLKFIGSLLAENSTKIGCLVDLTSILKLDTSSPQEIIEFVEKQCSSILHDSTLLVWKIQIENNQKISDDRFIYDLKNGSLKSNLIKMLIARQLYKTISPNQEVMFRVSKTEETTTGVGVGQNNDTQTHCIPIINYLDSVSLDRLLFRWGSINKVKIMTTMPAYDFNNPWKGHYPLLFPSKIESFREKYQRCYQ